MENIEITILSVIFLGVIAWAMFSPYRCPKCGAPTEDVYDEVTGKSYKVCTQCNYSEQVGEEDGDDRSKGSSKEQ